MARAIVFDAYGTLYDVQTVADAVEDAFPGRGAYITQVWRLKQLEYSWLRSMMGRYEDFWTVTRDALRYTLATLGIEVGDEALDDLSRSYDHLKPYADTLAGLDALKGHRLAILSNGSPAMLDALVRQSGLDHHFEAVMSVDPTRSYKPDPRAYAMVERTLGVPPGEILFVSCNGFDCAGAKAFGFRVAHIERVPATTLAAEVADASRVGPTTMFKALRMRDEALGLAPDIVIHRLPELAALVGATD